MKPWTLHVISLPCAPNTSLDVSISRNLKILVLLRIVSYTNELSDLVLMQRDLFVLY